MKTLRKAIAKVLIPVIILVNFPLSPFAAPAEEADDLKILHTKLKKVDAGETIPITATFEATEGLEVVRIYFRAVGTKPYFFVPMITSKGSEYYSILPAPDGSIGKMEYLFLVKTYNNRVFTSSEITAAVEGDGGKKAAASENEIVNVSVETKKVPSKIAGFSSNTKVRGVTQAEKHGVLAGLYDRKETGGSSSSGQYHGAVDVSKGSGYNKWLIGSGVAAGLLAIGVAAGSGGGSSSGGGSDSGSTGSGNGTWSLQFEQGECTRSTTQTVSCSAEGLVTSVSPTAIGLPLGESCSNVPFGGLADVFIVGGSCDSSTACNNYSSADLSSKSCNDKSMTFFRNDGVRVERWSVQ